MSFNYPNTLETKIYKDGAYLVDTEVIGNAWKPNEEDNKRILTKCYGGSVQKAKDDIVQRVGKGEPVPGICYIRSLKHKSWYKISVSAKLDAISELRLWLKEIDLQKYADKFEKENYINLKDIREMDTNYIEEMIKDLGIKGTDKSRIRRAIRTLKTKQLNAPSITKGLTTCSAELPVRSQHSIPEGLATRSAELPEMSKPKSLMSQISYSGELPPMQRSGTTELVRSRSSYSGGMEKVKEWLKSMKLQHYAKKFEENDYDRMDMIEELSADELEVMFKVCQLKSGAKIKMNQNLKKRKGIVAKITTTTKTTTTTTTTMTTRTATATTTTKTKTTTKKTATKIILPGLKAEEFERILADDQDFLKKKGISQIESELEKNASFFKENNRKPIAWKRMDDISKTMMRFQKKNSKFTFDRNLHRFPDVFPYDFNAMPNYIGSWMGDGFGLMQWPMPGSIPLLQKIITESNVGMIIALGRQEVQQRAAMISYWINLGEIISEKEHPACIVRKITNIPPNNTSCIIHHFPKWLDYDSPAQHSDAFHLTFLEISKLKKNGKRILVHCRAGVGRSGTLRLMYRAWKNEIYKENLILEFFKQRALRMFSIQRQNQFNFVQDYIESLETKTEPKNFFRMSTMQVQNWIKNHRYNKQLNAIIQNLNGQELNSLGKKDFIRLLTEGGLNESIAMEIWREFIAPAKMAEVRRWLQSIKLEKYGDIMEEKKYHNMEYILKLDKPELDMMIMEIGCKTGGAAIIRNSIKNPPQPMSYKKTRSVPI